MVQGSLMHTCIFDREDKGRPGAARATNVFSRPISKENWGAFARNGTTKTASVASSATERRPPMPCMTYWFWKGSWHSNIKVQVPPFLSWGFFWDSDLPRGLRELNSVTLGHFEPKQQLWRNSGFAQNYPMSTSMNVQRRLHIIHRGLFHSNSPLTLAVPRTLAPLKNSVLTHLHRRQRAHLQKHHLWRTNMNITRPLKASRRIFLI